MKGKKLFRYLGIFAQTAALSIFFVSALSLTAFANDETAEILGSDQGAEVSEMGHIPSGIDQQYYNYEGKSRRRTRSVLPQQFDLRQQALSSPVKNQSPWGSCWAFGTLSAMESSAMVQKSVSGSSDIAVPDYSERHLTWFSYQQQEGEGIISTKNQPFDVGGNRQIATGLLSSWAGVEQESEVPYLTGKSQVWSVDPKKLYDSVGHLQNADFLPGTAVFENYTAKSGYRLDLDAVNTIKKALMNNGVVDVSYYADQSRPDQTSVNGTYINNQTYAQYTDQYLTANHEVSIVGWDDDYSAENFLENRRPPGDGAWIVKNSWGKNWGNDGYFYLSYYDQSVNEFTSFYLDLPDEEGNYQYDHNYQYDYLGMKSVYGILRYPSSNVSVANVFTAGSYEELKAVSAVTTEPGSKVQIRIYKNPLEDNPESGTLVAEQTDTVSYGGYHTLELETPLILKPGDQFSVVQLITGDKGSYVPLELASTAPVFGGEALTNAKVEEGQSFWNQGNGWTDLANYPYKSKTVYSGNVMIKAFTVDYAVTARVQSVTVDSLDLGMQEIETGTSVEVSDSKEVLITLPAASAFVRIHPVLEDQGEVEIRIDEQVYREEDAIPRADFEGKIVTVVGKGKPDSIYYKYRFTVLDTVLTDNGVVLTDSHSYLPKDAVFRARVWDSQDEIYEEIRESLRGLGGGLFTVYAIRTTAGGSEIQLSEDGNVMLQFPKPPEFDEDRTRLFAADISSDHILTAISDMENGLQACVNNIGNSYYVVVEMKKIAQSIPGKPEISELPGAVTDHSIAVRAVEGQEYSIDNGTNWKSADQSEGGFTGLFEGLNPGTDYQVITRYAETVDTAASNPSEPLLVRTKDAAPTPDAVPAPVLVRHTDVSVEVETRPGQEYSIKGPGEEAFTEWQDSGLFEGLIPGTNYEIVTRIPQTDDTAPENISETLYLRTKDSAPPAPIAPETVEILDRSITVRAVPGQVYAITTEESADLDSQVWQKSGIFESLTDRTQYYIFTKQAESDTVMESGVSEPLSLMTLQSPGEAPDVPILVSAGSDRITIREISGQEYSINEGKNWQSAGTFGGLLPNRIYRVIARVCRTEERMESPSSPALDVRTDKREAAAPGAPQCIGITETSITVKTVNGQEYSIDGGKQWQNGGEFLGLKPNTRYEIQARTKENEIYKRSPVSAVLSITTKKVSDFQIRLNANGGKSEQSSIMVKNGNRYGSLPSPKRSKYTFKGWYTSKTGGKKISASSLVSLQNNQTLYARWSKVTTARVSSIKLSNPKKRQMAVKIKSVKGAKGYQIQYAESPSFKKGRKILDTGKSSKKISKLKKGRTYYVKVRAYKKDSCGKKIYGKYGKVKNITIKK